MEIGAVPGVRANSQLSVRRPESAHRPAFEIDPTARTGEETYSASHQAPERGLEEEDSCSDEDAEPEQASPSDLGDQSTKISIFA